MKNHIEEVVQIVSENNGRNNLKNTSIQNPVSIDIADRLIAFTLCFVFLAFALWIGIVSSRPFQWPFNWDTLRDIGIAQTLLDKTYPEDPILKGEVNWYNPLTGAVIALFSKILNKSLPETCMHIGPFLQLLLPISVMLLAWNRWGPWAGFLSLTYFIFARNPFLAEWLYSAYSPWLIAPQWGKTFFFLTILMFILYVEKKKILFAVFCGLFLGLGFLTHTAILIEAAFFIVLYSFIKTVQLYRFSQKQELNQYLKEIGIILGTALLLSSPYWLPILIKYQFVIRHPYPSLYLTPALELKNLPTTLLKSANGFTIIGVLSLSFFFIHWEKKELWWLRIWTIVVFLLVVQQVICQSLNYYGYTIPAFFPPHHNFMSVHALIGFWFVHGSLQLAAGIVLFLQRRNIHFWLQKGIYLVTLSLIFLIGITTLVKPIPPLHEIYRGTEENKLVHDVARFDTVYRWILNNTSPQDIFLCDEVTGIWTVMPAGRKLVYTLMFYMNPYCDINYPIEFFNYIWAVLQEQRYSDFLALCQQKNVKYILLLHSDKNKSLLDKMQKIRRCYEDHQVVVYEIP